MKYFIYGTPTDEEPYDVWFETKNAMLDWLGDCEMLLGDRLEIVIQND